MDIVLRKYYNAIAAGLIIIVMVLSFLVGKEVGPSTLNASDNTVVLSCDESVLNALSVGEQEPQGAIALPATLPSSDENSASTVNTTVSLGKFVGSKNGTKYYTPDCNGLSRINPENYVWFRDEEDARLQGYTPANC